MYHNNKKEIETPLPDKRQNMSNICSPYNFELATKKNNAKWTGVGICVGADGKYIY